MAVPLRKLTPEQYLAIERTAEYRSEYFGGEMFAMPGGTRRHSRLGLDIGWILSSRLKESGSPCEVFGPDMKVGTGPDGLYTYPDVSVTCGEPATDLTDFLERPKLIIEVLSASTEAHDRGFKFEQYKRIDTLEEYVLVSQLEPLIERFWRAAGGEWTGHSEVRGLDASLTLASVGLTIPLSEIYAGVQFGPGSGEAQS
jgi:Uma2 family endonuclease